MLQEKLTRAAVAPRRRPQWSITAALLSVVTAIWWADAARVPPPAAAMTVPGDAARGRELITAYHCGHCHHIPGVTAARGTVGPPLQGIARRSYIAGVVPNQPETLQRWLIDPAALVPGTPMPALGVNERDAQDIVAWLATLR